MNRFITLQLWADPARLLSVDAYSIKALIEDNRNGSTRTIVKATHGTWVVGDSRRQILLRIEEAIEP